jgi:hypothetical protein
MLALDRPALHEGANTLHGLCVTVAAQQQQRIISATASIAFCIGWEQVCIVVE